MNLASQRRGKFRPRICNDGEFLSYSCYVSEFPTTAFLDETDKSEWQKRDIRIAYKVMNGIADFVADAMGATEAPSFIETSINSGAIFLSKV